MNNNRNEELETIDRMYESGKITAEDRDRLIAAVNAAEEAEKADDKQSVGFLEGLKDLGEKLKELNGLNELEGLKELRGILDKTKGAIEKGVRKAKVVLKSDSNDDGDNVSIVINSDGDYDVDKNIIIKKHHEKYDVPYEKLVVTLKYINKATVITISESAEDSDKILEQCAEYLDEDSLNAVAELIKSRFTGSYKRIDGAIVLKLNVSPDDDGDEVEDD